MPKEVLSDTREHFKEQLEKAYRTARRDLNNTVVGEKVSLMFPYQEGETEGPRAGEVQGVVDSVEVGKLPHRNVEFTTYVTFQDGREFTDPETIEILS